MPIDTTRLQNITDGDIALQLELLGLYFDTVTRTMAVLKDTVDANDHAWREAAHEIKGASNTLGFETIGNICRQVELLKNLSPVGREAIYQELLTAIAEVRALQDELGNKI